jgi:hypothetical protein
VAHQLIKLSDQIGFDVHFIRFLYWTVLDSEEPEKQQPHEMITDFGLCIFMILMYALAMHFMLWPVDSYYPHGNI